MHRLETTTCDNRERAHRLYVVRDCAPVDMTLALGTCTAARCGCTVCEEGCRWGDDRNIVNLKRSKSRL